MLFVGNKLETDILCASKTEVISVRIRKGESSAQEPESAETTPKYEISKLSEMSKIVEKVEKARFRR
jgi:ribonucleotide monophosphatase NagD (HAD superfamily)